VGCWFARAAASASVRAWIAGNCPAAFELSRTGRQKAPPATRIKIVLFVPVPCICDCPSSFRSWRKRWFKTPEKRPDLPLLAQTASGSPGWIRCPKAWGPLSLRMLPDLGPANGAGDRHRKRRADNPYSMICRAVSWVARESPPTQIL
jgi:hypothetical protein